MAVSYETSMRARAINDRKGLYTLEVIQPGAKPGKFGSKICMQGPASADEYREVMDFMLGFMKRRNDRESSAKQTTK